MPVRTYLELASLAQLRPAASPAADADVARVDDCVPSFWRWLYTEVGRDYGWTDRLAWTDDQIRRYLATPGLEFWLMTVGGASAGYFELKPDQEAGIEIAYFGLLPPFTGRGFGKWLLTEAVRRAFEKGARRVWLHTCTLDHPSALPNYLARGFVKTRDEAY